MQRHVSGLSGYELNEYELNFPTIILGKVEILSVPSRIDNKTAIKPQTTKKSKIVNMRRPKKLQNCSSQIESPNILIIWIFGMRVPVSRTGLYKGNLYV